MKILAIYDTKYGSTKKYLIFLSKYVDLDIFCVNGFKFSKDVLNKYNKIIFASPIRFGRIIISKYILNNINNLYDKKIALLSTSLLDPSLAANIIKLENYYKNAFKNKTIRNKISYFPVLGFLEKINKLSFFDSLIVSLLAFFEKDKNKKERLLNPLSNNKLSNIDELIDWCNNS
jgi:menaquinone-dependent protoporphyrinogen IX oxidase